MLYYQDGIVNPQEMKKVPTGKEAADALDTLVGIGLSVTASMRANPNVSMDGHLFGGNDHA